MNLTEEKIYTLSLDIEGESDDALGNRIVEFTFTNKELLHAVITCGMPISRLSSAYIGKYQTEILQKIFVTETALEGQGEYLKKSTKTMYLDSSEKSMISYYMGMFFTKMISKKLYDVDYLANLNMIEGEDGSYMDYFKAKWRPDMIGYKVAEDAWSVWEAKGGSNRRAPALKLGCQQAGEIQTINGTVPETAAVCMTYYDHGYLTAIIKNAKADEGVLLKIDKKNYYKAYYEGIRQLFLEFGHTMKWEYGNVEVQIDVPYFHEEEKRGQIRTIKVGLSESLFQKIMKEKYEEIESIDRVPINKYQDDRFVGGDGVYIK